MNFSEEDIENYLLGKLHGEELADFEIRMSLDEELKRAVLVQKMLISAIQEGRKNELRDYIKQNSKKDEKRSVPLWNRRNITAGALVLSALVIGVFFYTKNNFNADNHETLKKESVSDFKKVPDEVQTASSAKTDTITESKSGETISQGLTTIDSQKQPIAYLEDEEKDMGGDGKTSSNAWDYGDGDLEDKTIENRIAAKGGKNEYRSNFKAKSDVTGDGLDSVRHDNMIADTVLYAYFVGENDIPMSISTNQDLNKSSGAGANEETRVATGRAKLATRDRLSRKSAAEKVAPAPDESGKPEPMKAKADNAGIRVEFWESAINFKGYRFFKNELKLYGVGKNERVQLYNFSGMYYLKLGRNVYNLIDQNSYNPFILVKNKEIIDKTY